MHASPIQEGAGIHLGLEITGKRDAVKDWVSFDFGVINHPPVVRAIPSVKYDIFVLELRAVDTQVIIFASHLYVHLVLEKRPEQALQRMIRIRFAALADS